jgi:molybdopterin molybdotransferase
VAGGADAVAAPPRLADPATALDALLALLPGLVPPRRVPVAAAVGRVLAETLVALGPVPPERTAARDGWAVASADTQGAGSYSPAPLVSAPLWVRSGSQLPPGADAVLPDWAVLEGPLPQAVEPAAPGEGVRLPGEDVAAGIVLRPVGERLRATDLPALHACNFDQVAVRAPRVALVGCGDELVADWARDGLGPFLAALLAAEGVDPLPRPPVPDSAEAIAAALLAVAAETDLVLLLGGTGNGREDRAAEGLAAAGRVALHGLGSRPGASAGVGLAGGTAVVLVPGRWEDAYAAWLLLVRSAVRHLTGMARIERPRARLTRKVASAVGLLDVVPVRRAGPGLAEPLAVGALPPGVLAAADAVLLVPPSSEGYDAGADVDLELL